MRSASPVSDELSGRSDFWGFALRFDRKNLTLVSRASHTASREYRLLDSINHDTQASPNDNCESDIDLDNGFHTAGPNPGEFYESMLATAFSGSRELVTLVVDLTKVVRIESGDSEAKPTTSDMALRASPS
jgi:hypothetical protein